MLRAQLNPAEAAAHLEQAETQFRQGIQLNPDDGECQVDPAELAAYRAGSKLWPDWTIGRLALVSGLRRAGQAQEARQVFAEIPQPPSQDYEAAIYCYLMGNSATNDRDWRQAEECLLKSISIWPVQNYAYFDLGGLYVRQHRLADARTALRSCLRNEPHESIARIARAVIARINEEIGVEATPETTQPDPKPQ